jgi:hypothetical protein
VKNYYILQHGSYFNIKSKQRVAIIPPYWKFKSSVTVEIGRFYLQPLTNKYFHSLISEQCDEMETCINVLADYVEKWHFKGINNIFHCCNDVALNFCDLSSLNCWASVVRAIWDVNQIFYAPSSVENFLSALILVLKGETLLVTNLLDNASVMQTHGRWVHTT